MSKLKDLSKDTGFKEPEELVKFLFVINNTNTKVREYLIDKGKPMHTCTELLTMTRSIEGMVKTETLYQVVWVGPQSQVYNKGVGAGVGAQRIVENVVKDQESALPTIKFVGGAT